MRTLLIALTTVGAMQLVAQAQSGIFRRDGACDCGCHGPVQDNYSHQKGKPPTNLKGDFDDLADEPDLAVPEISPGMFAAPPRAGTVTGATRGLGLPGLKLTLHELSFRLPSIEIPGFTLMRRTPTMRLEAAEAPYVSNPNYLNAVAQRDLLIAQLQRARLDQDLSDLSRLRDMEDEIKRLKAMRDDVESKLQQYQDLLQQLDQLDKNGPQQQQSRRLPQPDIERAEWGAPEEIQRLKPPPVELHPLPTPVNVNATYLEPRRLPPPLR